MVHRGTTYKRHKGRERRKEGELRVRREDYTRRDIGERDIEQSRAHNSTVTQNA